MSSKNFSRIWVLLLLFFLLGGCAIGFDHTLFMTKSNVGVDIDTKSPTAEISIARRELVIAPAFEGGQTPPVLAGFRTDNRMLFGFGVSSIFSGGDAAYIVARQEAVGKVPELCLNEKPVGKPSLGPISFGNYPLPAAGEIHPFVFGTDTIFGLKVAWSGMTAQFPDSLKIGFNRKELALAPVFVKDVKNNKEEDSSCSNYSVNMPAFLATIEVNSNATLQSFNLAYEQSFSTGSAAVEVAKRPYVKNMIMARLDRAPKESGTFKPDKNSGCINQWLESDKTQGEAKTEEINNWLEKEKYETTSTFLIYEKEFADARAKFIKEKNIKCKEE